MVRLIIWTSLGLIAGLVIGGFAGWAIGKGHAEVQVLEGFTSAVNSTGTAIGLSPERGGGGPGYDIAGAWWRQADTGGPWARTSPTCAAPMTFGQRVRLGVVEVEPTASAPGGTKVVWLECLDNNSIPMDSAPLEAARRDLASRLGVDVAQIAVVSIEEVSWSDTSLGCPEPGKEYAQVIVPGFRIKLELGGQEYEYHTDEDGSQMDSC